MPALELTPEIPFSKHSLRFKSESAPHLNKIEFLISVDKLVPSLLKLAIWFLRIFKYGQCILTLFTIIFLWKECGQFKSPFEPTRLTFSTDSNLKQKFKTSLLHHTCSIYMLYNKNHVVNPL